jgi:hypothetical protein
MTRTTPGTRTAILLTVGLVLTAALAGCGSAKNNSSSGAGGPAPAALPQDEGAKAPAPLSLPSAPSGGGASNGAVAAGAGGGAPAGKPGAPAAATGRSVVYNGSITVRVDDVGAKASQLTALAIGAGGLVSGDERHADAGRSTATVTLRIPASQFSDVLNQIGRLGREESRNVSSQDVTATVIDLQARITSQQASVDRVRALLARAQSISDITSIESELARREADLESMQAQQRNLSDLVALSTIAVSLLGPDAAGPPVPKPAETGFLAGLKAGWKAFSGLVQVLLTILGAVLPFLVAIGVPVLAVYLWLRRRYRRRQAPAAGPALSSETVAPKAGSAM